MKKQKLRSFEMRILRSAREKYRLKDSCFSISGDVIFANYSAAREMTALIRQKKEEHSNQIKAGELFALALLHEVYHRICAVYKETKNPKAFALAGQEASRAIAYGLEDSIEAFTELYPPQEVYLNKQSTKNWLKSNLQNRTEESLEELLLLSIAIENPAAKPYRFLFDMLNLRLRAPVDAVLDSIEKTFKSLPKMDEEESLIDALRAPALAFPNSLSAQLDYVAKRWGSILGDIIKSRLLGAKAMLAEEQRAVFPPGPGPVKVISYAGLDSEYEGYSDDKDWMPRVVMIAKSTLVWLDQLSKKYNREIKTLDAIPDEELDILAGRGFNGLWLIGVWERSDASRRIKELCGNPEAAASAYSLYDYEIAGELGGWHALERLRAKAWQRGIRLAADMVPNHTGLDSAWIRERPELFVSRGTAPFPAYTYNGENLSGDSRYGLWIEDHYYNRQDAAVTFKRVDFRTGATGYIYHGNDGTSMPWNDTAQIDFLKKEAREAVKERILHVAKNFPIIRFDAAMVLAKRSFRRLWYPEPGAGDAIASRFESALTVADFNASFPDEFWREVVDMCAQEAPDTLLLAEAFWMMEGYFVRTLGMHRVYNSAFMNMLKTKSNAEYRAVIKNTIEFDKDILKRFVNFMNNPDEDTAIAQFGDGDHYFGVCSLMATLPGLPMFGHGQFEGLKEKYGMEYRKAYMDENQNDYIVDRHYREIVPLLKRRWLFSDVKNFLFYDFYKHDGSVDENVFAYSNGQGKDRAIVLFNNYWERSSGHINRSCIYMDKREDGQLPAVTKTLLEGLGFHSDPFNYIILTEERSGLSFLRNSEQLAGDGLFVALEGFQCQVFSGIYQIKDDNSGSYSALCNNLSGKGVSDIDAALQDLSNDELYSAWKALFNADYFAMALQDDNKPEKTITKEKSKKVYSFDSLLLEKLLSCLPKKTGLSLMPKAEEKCLKLLDNSVKLLDTFFNKAELDYAEEARAAYLSILTIIPLAFLSRHSQPEFGEACILAENLGFRRKLFECLTEAGLDKAKAELLLSFAFTLFCTLDSYEALAGYDDFVELIQNNSRLSSLSGLNYWEGEYWINEERIELFIVLMAAIQIGIFKKDNKKAYLLGKNLINTLKASGWRLNGLKDNETKI